MEYLTYNTGDKPGEGKYRCKACNHVVYIDTDEEELPFCPKCSDLEWIKVE